MPAAGTYEFTRSDDAGGLIMVAEGGRYTAALSGGELEDGVWRREGALSCLVAGGPSERKLCYSFAAPDARGRSRGTGPAGTITLRKME